MRLKACIVTLVALLMLQPECGALENMIVSRMVDVPLVAIDVKEADNGTDISRSPLKAPNIKLLGNELLLFEQFGNAQLVIRSATESYSICLSGGEESVTLPNLPNGVYELLIYDEVCAYRGELHIG